MNFFEGGEFDIFNQQTSAQSQELVYNLLDKHENIKQSHLHYQGNNFANLNKVYAKGVGEKYGCAFKVHSLGRGGTQQLRRWRGLRCPL